MKKNVVGNLLIANPTNPEDELSRSVLLCLTHNKQVGIGLQINRLQSETDLATISHNLGIRYHGRDPIWYGGNISIDKVHIIHSLDWRGMGTLCLNKHIGVTHDISILAAIASGKGPKFFKACAGYWLFDEGRLDTHLSKAIVPEDPFKWETIPANIDNIFGLDPETMWESCLQETILKKVKTFFSY